MKTKVTMFVLKWGYMLLPGAVGAYMAYFRRDLVRRNFKQAHLRMVRCQITHRTRSSLAQQFAIRSKKQNMRFGTIRAEHIYTLLRL